MDTESADFEEIVLSAWVLFWSRATEAIELPHWEGLPRCARIGFRDACREVIGKAEQQAKPEDTAEGHRTFPRHIYAEGPMIGYCRVCGGKRENPVHEERGTFSICSTCGNKVSGLTDR